MKTAIISGTSINRSRVFENWGTKNIETPFGAIEARERGNLLVLNRHGFSSPRLAHASNFKGNAWAIRESGAEQAIALSSVGSLNREIGPGEIVSCSDYVSFWPLNVSEDASASYMPFVANGLIPEIEEAVPFSILSNKVYAQTRGPRFETKAEVRVLASWECDVVGMTFAHEADTILELGVALNSLCIVDNFAHGIADGTLSMESFKETVSKNQAKVDRLLMRLVDLYG